MGCVLHPSLAMETRLLCDRSPRMQCLLFFFACVSSLVCSPQDNVAQQIVANGGIPALVALLSYWGIWNAGFCFDDPMAIVNNPLVNGEAGWLDAFTSTFWGDRPGFEHLQSWRPLTVLDLRIDHVASGGAPWSFHVGNLILVAMLATAMAVSQPKDWKLAWSITLRP